MKKTFIENIHVDFKGQIKDKKRIEKYVKSVLHYFMPRLRRNIFVEVKFTKDLGGDYGYCLGSKDHVEIEIGKYNFSLDQMMVTLAHELIHAKQFLKGELTPTMKNWKTFNYEGVPYSRQPWEREAYKKEEFIYELFWVK